MAIPRVLPGWHNVTGSECITAKKQPAIPATRGAIQQEAAGSTQVNRGT